MTMHPQDFVHHKAAESKAGGEMELYRQYMHLTRAVLATGFYENCFSFLLIPYPLHHSSDDLLT